MAKRARQFSLVLTALLAMASSMTAANAATTEIISPRGLRIWLAEDHGTPVVTLGFRFAGGSSQDPPGKEGLARIAAEMFFQGGGSLSADDYIGRWNQLGAEINIEARLESVRGTVKVVSQDRDKAMDLLALAVNEPRFDAGSLEQVRGQAASAIESDADDPEAAAYRVYDSLAFGSHPRARPVAGTQDSIRTIAPSDVAAFRRKVMVRGGLYLSAAGDITPAELGPLADRIFAGLPAQGQINPVAAPMIAPAVRRDLPMRSEQAQVAFGLALPDLTPREQLAAELVNYTLGGSAFTSRLYHQIREQRGLAYSIGTSLDRYSFMAELSGSLGSAPDTVEETVALVRQEFDRLNDHPPTGDEIAEAKAALSGQYLRGIIKQTDMADELTLRMSEGADTDAIESYANRFATITPDEVRALATRIHWSRRLVVVTAGAPAAAPDKQAASAKLQTPPAREP